MPPLDLQVNGYGGIDFNQNGLTAEALHTACTALQRDGVGAILATIITADLPDMAARLRTLDKLRAADPLAQQLIAGIHIEGPFLSPEDGYRGAHLRTEILPGDVGTLQNLLDAAAGLVRLVTLAPECDPRNALTRFLADRNIAVAAGHTNATLPQLTAACDAGLTLFTHLGNGCPAQLPRHDNIIQRVLSLRERFWITFIADGAHIPFFVLRNYLDLVGLDRAIIVTDAIAPAGLGPGRYTLGQWDLNIGPDMVARSPDGSHLVGSACGLPRVIENLRGELGLNESEIAKLIRLNPRRALKIM